MRSPIPPLNAEEPFLANVFCCAESDRDFDFFKEIIFEVLRPTWPLRTPFRRAVGITVTLIDS